MHFKHCPEIVFKKNTSKLPFTLIPCPNNLLPILFPTTSPSPSEG